MNYVELSNIAINNLSHEEINICNSYIKFINKKINDQLGQSKFREKLFEAIALGLPYYIDENLNINTLPHEEFYKVTKPILEKD